jgi:hypothetical protein
MKLTSWGRSKGNPLRNRSKGGSLPADPRELEILSNSNIHPMGLGGTPETPGTTFMLGNMDNIDAIVF